MIHNFDALERRAIEQTSKRVALAMAEEDDALSSLANAAKMNIAEPILVGNEKSIREIAEKEGIDISGFPIIPAQGEYESAAKAIELVKNGKAEILMKGKIATSSLMKAVLDRENAIRGTGLLSHITLMEIPSYGKLLIMTDAALSIAPDLQTKAGIITNAVEYAHRLGLEKPKVAVIGAVEKVNTDMSATVDAALLSKMADRGQIKGCIVDGPFALDNAVSKKSCEVKGIVSEVGGDADILLMPDIEAANVMYKTIAYLTDYKMAGVIVGAKVPIVLPSRADSETTKYLSILAAVS